MLTAFGEHLMTSLHSDVTKIRRRFYTKIRMLENNHRYITRHDSRVRTQKYSMTTRAYDYTCADLIMCLFVMRLPLPTSPRSPAMTLSVRHIATVTALLMRCSTLSVSKVVAGRRRRRRRYWYCCLQLLMRRAVESRCPSGRCGLHVRAVSENSRQTGTLLSDVV